MKKKIICLLCAIAMVLGVLTSCSSGSEGEDTGGVIAAASEATQTLSMYVVVEKEVSEETAKLVTDAFNKITKSNFKTQVVLHFLTYDKYFQTIETMIAENSRHEELGEEAEKAFRKAKKEAKADGVATDEAWEDSWYAEHPQYIEFRETEELTGEDTTAEETVMVTVEGASGFQMSELKYPEEKNYQLDIIWIDSYDRYMQYISNEWLFRLDDELNGASKKLKEYISPSLLAWVKWSSQGTYAIPNNSAIGEYTYLLLSKNLMDKYNYDSANITDTTSDLFKNYIKDVATYENGIVPILGDIPLTNVLYWDFDKDTRSINTKQFSLMGAVYGQTASMDPTKSDNTPVSAKNIFTVESYANQLRTIQSFKDAGYIVDEAKAAGKEYAARVVKGGAELQKEYGDDYYMVTLEYPRIEEEDLFSSMFAVTNFTRSSSRSMEIITYLNTNAALRNVLQYGVEGVHYTLGLDGVVKRLNNDYMMNIRNTGNEFVAAPEEGMPADIWDYGKKQNLDIKAGMLNCFRVDTKFLESTGAEGEVLLDVAQLDSIRSTSARYAEKLAAVKNSAELEALIAEASSAEAAAIKKQISTREESALYAIYYNVWMQDVGLYIPVEE